MHQDNARLPGTSQAKCDSTALVSQSRMKTYDARSVFAAFLARDLVLQLQLRCRYLDLLLGLSKVAAADIR